MNAAARSAGNRAICREIDFVSAQSAQETLAGWKLRYDEIMGDPELAKRFALEQRIDALNARLMYIEDRICRKRG